MTYNVKLSPHALRQYKNIDPYIKSKIQQAIDKLEVNPFNSINIKPLKGALKDYYRYRVGDYRIIYLVDSKNHLVYIDYIQHRKDVYRKL